MRAVALVMLVLALTACGGEHEHGTATLWVTRDRGANVLYTGTVPAGLNAIQALERAQQVTTRYGGRYVQSIAGVSGSLASEHDWFLFVNGVESGTGAAEVRLRPGDVEWWDYRSWRGGAMTVPVVAGAFPEPFLHGFQWAKPGATVLYDSGAFAAVAHRLAVKVHGAAELAREGVGGEASSTPTAGNVIAVGPGPTWIHQVGEHVVLHLAPGDASRLAHDPAALRFRYQVAG